MTDLTKPNNSLAQPLAQALAQASIGHVLTYFDAVDRMDIKATLACFATHARFTIASFGTTYQGRDGEIKPMFERLFARYAQVWHGDFDHLVQAADGSDFERIASRFTVINTTHEGLRSEKNNCNFFRFQDGLITEVFVYMSGDNSLR